MLLPLSIEQFGFVFKLNQKIIRKLEKGFAISHPSQPTGNIEILTSQGLDDG